MHSQSLQSCPTFCNPLDCSLPASSAHEILQARLIDWIAVPSSRGSSWPRDQTHISYVSCIGKHVLYHWHHLRSWEYTEELYKKCFNDLDNHNGVVTHLEPYLLKSEVKWALGSITTNKASGGDRIPAELFQILKLMLWKCCNQYASKFGKPSSSHRTGKGQFSF